MNRAQQLSAQFYAWELRGRGWYAGDTPIRLEPPFSPFPGHTVHTHSHDLDDGKEHTLFSAIGAGLLVVFRGAEKTEKQASDTAEPIPFWGDPHLTVFRLGLPLAVSESQEQAKQFLLSLPTQSLPMSFELIGRGGSVSIQLTCREQDREAVDSQLRAIFPNLQVSSGSDVLWENWREFDDQAVLELGLESEFMLPLASPKTEALTPIVGALSQTGEDELSVLQVLFEPASSPWAASALQAVSDGRGRPFFADAPETLALAKEKMSSPLFGVGVKLCVQTPDTERRSRLMRSLLGSFAQFSRSGSNALTPLDATGYPHHFQSGDVTDRITRRAGMLLNLDELASLVHLPSKQLSSSALERQLSRTRLAPARLEEGPLALGKNTHGGQVRSVRLTTETRLRHMHIVGATGTGKSTLMLDLIRQDMQSGQGLAVLDPHGDLVDEVLARVPEDRVNDVVLLDPSDPEYVVGLNVLEAHSELEAELLASDLVSVFRRLSTSWGDQMNSVLANAVMAILDSSAPATLLDLRRFLVEDGFRASFLKRVEDSEIRYYWNKEYPLLRGKPQAPILTRLNAFLRPKSIRAMVSRREKSLDVRSLMDSGRILLAKLSQGRVGQENAYLLGALLLSKIHQIAQSRQDVGAAHRAPFFLYVDEFQHFLTPSTSAILSGARKFGLGLVLAHQSLSQLGGHESGVLGAAVANPATRVCFRVGEADARRLREGFAHFDSSDLLNLGVGQAICRVEKASADFNLETVLAEPISEDEAAMRRDLVTRVSRERFAQLRTDTAQAPEPTVAGQVVESTPAPKGPMPTPQATPGRGGREHKRLQQLFRRQAQSLGYKASTEHALAEGAGSIDLLLRRDDDVIACEISTSASSLDQELKNVRKCLAAGVSVLCLVAGSPKRREALKKQLSDQLESAEHARILLQLPDEFLSWLQGRALKALDSETRSRGYRVKLSREATTEADQDARKKNLANVLRRLFRKDT